MTGTTKEQLISAVHRLQRVDFFPHNKHFDFFALTILKSIEDNSTDSQSNTYMFELQEELGITKGAISQIVSNLEKKGYLTREVDKSNRRKLVLTLTPEGRDALCQAYDEFDKLLSIFLSRLGDDDTREATRLFNRFADIAKEIHMELSNGSLSLF